MRRRATSASTRWPLLFAVAWLPSGLLWFVYVYARRGDAIYALQAAVVVTAAMALFGPLIWRACRRFPWDAGRRAVALAVHLGTGAAFVVTAIGVAVAFTTVHDRATPARVLRGALVEAHLAAYLLTALYGVMVVLAYWRCADERLRDQQVSLAQAEALAAREQLRALRAQLDPHFLLNALHAVVGLVRADPAAAEQGLERLGRLLRYVLDNFADEQVALDDEWRFARDYLALEALRLGPRLTVEAQIEPGALDVPVPPFSLQILVENAIKHAVVPRSGPSRLRVDARVAQGSLRLVVTDDGPGTGPRAPHSGGRGLRTLEQQLTARYGARARLSAGPAPGGGFEAAVCVPVEEEAAEPPSAARPSGVAAEARA